MSKYNTKTSVPHYEVKGEQVPLSKLYDRKKYDELKEHIKQVELPEDVRKFLIMAASRHIRFNYGKIAEYYAQAPKEVQELIEESALVIIDFDNAIANGYVQLSDEIKKIVEKKTK